MSKAEIKRKLDEIVAFAEIEEFIDTPVQSYSSGMRIRLGFAVAAHLEHETLLVDEVFAVGDMAFQRKSLRHMMSFNVKQKELIIFYVCQVETGCIKLCNGTGGFCVAIPKRVLNAVIGVLRIFLET